MSFFATQMTTEEEAAAKRLKLEPDLAASYAAALGGHHAFATPFGLPHLPPGMHPAYAGAAPWHMADPAFLAYWYNSMAASANSSAFKPWSAGLGAPSEMRKAYDAALQPNSVSQSAAAAHQSKGGAALSYFAANKFGEPPVLQEKQLDKLTPTDKG